MTRNRGVERHHVMRLAERHLLSTARPTLAVIGSGRCSDHSQEIMVALTTADRM